MFVAFGLAMFELGILMANILFPVAVGGMLLFVGSIVGSLRESEYISDPWKALISASVVSFVIGGVIWLTMSGSIRLRGTAILIGGVVLLLGGVAGAL